MGNGLNNMKVELDLVGNMWTLLWIDSIDRNKRWVSVRREGVWRDRQIRARWKSSCSDTCWMNWLARCEDLHLCGGVRGLGTRWVTWEAARQDCSSRARYARSCSTEMLASKPLTGRCQYMLTETELKSVDSRTQLRRLRREPREVELGGNRGSQAVGDGVQYLVELLHPTSHKQIWTVWKRKKFPLEAWSKSWSSTVD